MLFVNLDDYFRLDWSTLARFSYRVEEAKTEERRRRFDEGMICPTDCIESLYHCALVRARQSIWNLLACPIQIKVLDEHDVASAAAIGCI